MARRIERPMIETHGDRRMQRSACAVWASVMCVLVSVASGQPTNPVYLDDSPAAVETLRGLAGLTGTGNLSEAVRVVQGLLDDAGDRLIEVPREAGEADDGSRVYRTVRWRVHRVLIDDPALLARYREDLGAAAADLVTRGEHRLVERTMLLTEAGYEATLRVAQEELESARFESARLTLEQLEDHPDRAGARGVQAAELMALVARYLDRDEVWARAQRWADEAGGGAIERTVVPAPQRVVVEALSPSLGGRELALGEMVARPLHSVTLEGIAAAFDSTVVGQQNRTVASRWLPWVFPAVSGDTVYVNDGRSISAWDRFTLGERWVVTPGRGSLNERFADGRGYGRRGELLIEDTASVGIGRDTVVAITGWVLEGDRFGDGRVHGIDRATGRLLWSWHPGDLDADLRSVTLRGEPVVVGDVVLVSGRKEVIERRLRSAYLFALDVRTGAVRWRRLLASVGALPYLQDHGVSARTLVHQGVAYRADEIGVVAAVEVGSGRVVWIRTSPTAALPSYDPVACFAMPAPVLDGRTMIVLSGDRRRVMRVELDSGRVVAQRGAGRLGQPRYLLRAGDRLVAIGREGAISVPIERFDRAGVVRVELPAEDQIVGRAIVNGASVLLPVAEGIWSFPAAGGEGALVPLASSGNMVALPGQLLVAHGQSLHSYLVWEVAQGVLRERMESDQSDAEPALTYAELAYQTGRTERLIEAVDRALEAIGREDAGSSRSRQRLFDLLLAIVRRAETVRGAAGDGVGSSEGWPAPVTDGALLGAVVDRLGRTARTSRQRVAAMIATSTFQAHAGRPDAALAALTGVLDDELLASTMWVRDGLWVRGDVEVAQRIAGLIEADRGGVARAYEQRAGAALAGAQDNEDRLERVGRRYPGTLAGARAWLTLAALRERTGRGGLAERALERAVAGLASTRTGGGDELISRARAELGRLRAARGDVLGAAWAMGDAGGPIIDTAKGLVRGAQLGTTIDGRAVLRGWQLMQPIDTRDTLRVRPYAVVGRQVETDEGPVAEVGVIRPGGAGPLAVEWSRRFSAGVRLVRADADAVYLHDRTRWERRVVCLDARDGSERWSRAGVLAWHGADRGEAFVTPMDGRVRPGDALVAGDGATLVIAERGGRLAGIDLATGAVLWNATGAMDRVHDLAVRSGRVVLAGAQGGTGVATLGEQRVVVLDARTGAELAQLAGDAGPIAGAVRWVRLGIAGEVLAGFEGGIARLDPLDLAVVWAIDESWAGGSLDAWTVGGRLIVLGADRTMHQVELASGRGGAIATGSIAASHTAVLVEPIAGSGAGTEGPIGHGAGAARAWLDGSVAISSGSGVVVVDRGGAVVGADALDAGDALVPPVAGAGVVVAVDRRRGARSGTFGLYLLDATGRLVGEPTRLRLDRDQTPGKLELLDGVIVVGTDDGVIALRASADPEAAELR